MARVGYARVSSVGQSLEAQLDKLVGCACDKTDQEKKSGFGDGGKRLGLEACLEYVREGDPLRVTRDRNRIGQVAGSGRMVILRCLPFARG